jgi:(S)-3,5-dihydroxyphenylglycine transaminase
LKSESLQLHPALLDPVLGSMNFLNEIMIQYPNAISLAPGAPNPAFTEEFDISTAIDVYIKYIVQQRGVDAQMARKMLFEYGPSKGIINDLIAEALARDEGLVVNPGSIVVTVGAQEAMLLVLRALIRGPHDRLAVSSPCYIGIIGAARLLNVNIVAIPETDDGPDQTALAMAVNQARAEGASLRALCLSPDYANPSGVIMSLKARRSLLAFAEREGMHLVEDGAYAFTAGILQRMPSLKALDMTRQVIYIGTFSKTCMPGARVGYVIADQIVDGPGGRLISLADALGQIKSMVSVNTSPISQAIVGGMLLRHGGSIRSLGAKKAALYQRNLKILISALKEAFEPLIQQYPTIRITQPSGGFFVRLRLPLQVDSTLLKRSAAEFGVLWTPMSVFYLEVGGGAQEMRLSCSYLSPDEIIEGVRRLATLSSAVCSDNCSGVML